MMGPMKSKTRSMESMWRDLPASVLERVFTFLPIASLCRFRTLSKQWNRSISRPTFKHAGASEEDYALITPRDRTLRGGWVVLDVARKRYFTLSDAFFTEHVQRHGLVGTAGGLKRPTYLAGADGGLFCLWYFFTEKTLGLFVCNPVLRTVKALPHAAGVELAHEKVVMATDRSSMEYEILIVNTTKGRTVEPESILVYESKMGRWRTAPYRPVSYQIRWDSLTIFNNNLYCIVNKGDSTHDGLVFYDKQTGVVSDLHGIDFPSAPGSHLVVSKARLFCVIPEEDLGPSVEIFEIDVVKRASIQLTKMPRTLLLWVLCHDIEYGFYIVKTKIKVATGSADCILIASVVGRCAAYSLSRQSWYRIPEDRTLLKAYCGGATDFEEIFGSNNCLSLCAP